MVSPKLSTLFQPNSQSMAVIHPSYKDLGRIWIPLHYVQHTNGVDRYFSHHPHPPSLCMLFQQGRCNASSRCNQLHIQREYMNNIDDLISTTPSGNCCFRHGDMASCREDFQTLLHGACRIEVQVEGLASFIVAPDQIAVTTYWDRLLKNKENFGQVILFSWKRVCNLHQSCQCKYGVDCKNVHLCRDIWTFIHNKLVSPSALPSLIPRQLKTQIEIPGKNFSQAREIISKKEEMQSTRKPLTSIFASMTQAVQKQLPITNAKFAPSLHQPSKSKNLLHESNIVTEVRSSPKLDETTRVDKIGFPIISCGEQVLNRDNFLPDSLNLRKEFIEKLQPALSVKDKETHTGTRGCDVVDLETMNVCTGNNTDGCFDFDMWSPSSFKQFWASEMKEKICCIPKLSNNTSETIPDFAKNEEAKNTEESQRLHKYLLRGASPPPCYETSILSTDNTDLFGADINRNPKRHTLNIDQWSHMVKVSRGRFKSLHKKNSNILGLPVVRTRGPNTCSGFAVGRGIPNRE